MELPPQDFPFTWRQMGAVLSSCAASAADVLAQLATQGDQTVGYETVDADTIVHDFRSSLAGDQAASAPEQRILDQIKGKLAVLHAQWGPFRTNGGQPR